MGHPLKNRTNRLLDTIITILKYEETKEKLLHKEVYKIEENKRPFNGYIISRNHLSSNQYIDLVCFRVMSNWLEIFRIETNLEKLDCLNMIRTINNEIEYFRSGIDSLYKLSEDTKIVANLVTFAKKDIVAWLQDNKHLLQDSEINQIWIFRENEINIGKPFRLHPKDLFLDYLIHHLNKIEKG
ncbi:MAG: hypothetical protein ACXACU_04755 [Candidatus Hodarchaeales archaeon]|jgi:hypothetical protein